MRCFSAFENPSAATPSTARRERGERERAPAAAAAGGGGAADPSELPLREDVRFVRWPR